MGCIESTQGDKPTTKAGMCLLVSPPAWLHAKEHMNLALPTNHQPVSLLEEQYDDKEYGRLSSLNCTGSQEARTPSPMCIHRVFNQNLSPAPKLAGSKE